MSALLADAALAYAASGWSVFPCEPRGKRPLARLAPHALKDAARDLSTIARWWRLEPDANIGLSCGPAGLLVLDIDGEEGEAAIRALQGRYGTLGETPAGSGPAEEDGRSSTARGAGFRIARASLGPGWTPAPVGGYVILPPSVHPSGKRYTWRDESAIAPLPPWLRRLLTDRPIPATLRAPVEVGDGSALR